MLEGVSGTAASRRRELLRQRAKRAVALVGLCLTVLVGTAQAQPVGVAHLGWQDESGDETAFNIERKAEACAGSSVPFAPLASVAANVTVHHDIVWALGTYCYRVNAANPSGVSRDVEGIAQYSNLAERTWTAPEVPQPGVLGVGAVVITSAALNVRVAPGGALAGPYQPARAGGVVVNGPVVLQGQNWWEIDYDTSTPPSRVHRGWSVESASACPATLCLLAQ